MESEPFQQTACTARQKSITDLCMDRVQIGIARRTQAQMSKVRVIMQD